MPEFLIPLINLLIVFLMFFLVFGLVYLISKVCRLITTVYFYFFIASILTFLLSFEIGSNYLEFYPTMGSAFDASLSIISYPFVIIYQLFVNAIVGIASTFIQDVESISNYLLSDIPLLYIVIFQGVMFLLCLLIFRKKAKKNLDNSTYRE